MEGHTSIGHHTIINSQSHITAYARIGNYVFFGALVSTTNDKDMKWYRVGHGKQLIGATVEDYVRIGNTAVLFPDITIGRGSIIGAGAVVRQNVPEAEVWGGVPAKKLKVLDDPLHDFEG